MNYDHHCHHQHSHSQDWLDHPMKMQEALDIINKKENPGFMVAFSYKKNRVIHFDYFPDQQTGEQLIATEAEAWKLAEAFAEKTRGKFIGIYVVKSDFTPVESYKDKYIPNSE